MLISNSGAEQNRILASLPSKERNTLEEHLELVSLQTKEVLSELNSPVRYLHFPIIAPLVLWISKREATP